MVRDLTWQSNNTAVKSDCVVRERKVCVAIILALEALWHSSRIDLTPSISKRYGLAFALFATWRVDVSHIGVSGRSNKIADNVTVKYSTIKIKLLLLFIITRILPSFLNLWSVVITFYSDKQSHIDVGENNTCFPQYRRRAQSTVWYTVWVKKSSPPKTFYSIFFSRWTCLIENYLDYCPNIFLCLHQFWSIYLDICVKCIIFTAVTPQILRIRFSLLRNSWS